MSRPIVRAVKQCIRLQECADADGVKCDFGAWWSLYALPLFGRIEERHMHAVRRDERAKRGPRAGPSAER